MTTVDLALDARRNQYRVMARNNKGKIVFCRYYQIRFIAEEARQKLLQLTKNGKI